MRKMLKFLWKQVSGLDFWLLVLCCILIYYLLNWRMRLRDNIFNLAGEFAKRAL